MSLPFWALTKIDTEKHFKEFITISKVIIYLSRYEFFFGQFADILGCEIRNIIDHKKIMKIFKSKRVIDKINEYNSLKNLDLITPMDFIYLVDTACTARKELHHEDFMSLDIKFECLERHETMKIIKRHVEKIIDVEFLLIIYLSKIKGEKLPPSDYKEIIYNWIFEENNLILKNQQIGKNIVTEFEIEDNLVNEIEHDYEIMPDDNNNTTIVTKEEFDSFLNSNPPNINPH
ncbi:MAG: hypothetical protein JXR63_04920 [Spirochaetales bacterium]|nr:hypothetical protein [Spirochaetales bacterium]